MMDSVILVTVRSRLSGSRFLTPLMSDSNWLPRAPDWSRSVRRLEMEEKPRRRSVEVDDVVEYGALELELEPGCVGAEVSIVMRVISRTLFKREGVREDWRGMCGLRDLGDGERSINGGGRGWWGRGQTL